FRQVGNLPPQLIHFAKIACTAATHAQSQACARNAWHSSKSSNPQLHRKPHAEKYKQLKRANWPAAMATIPGTHAFPQSARHFHCQRAKAPLNSPYWSPQISFILCVRLTGGVRDGDVFEPGSRGYCEWSNLLCGRHGSDDWSFILAGLV